MRCLYSYTRLIFPPAIYIQDWFRSVFPPVPREVYQAQTGFISSSSVGDDTDLYPPVNFTTILPTTFVAPSDPDVADATPDPSLWIEFAGTSPPTAPSSTTATETPIAATQTPSSTSTCTCKMHVDEYEICSVGGSESSDLFANASMANSDGGTIGDTVINTTYPWGMPINVGDSYSFEPGPLPAIVITGEHEGDYIRFTQGDLTWTSRTTTGTPNCTNGGWDPKDGPVCGLKYGDRVAVCVIHICNCGINDVRS